MEAPMMRKALLLGLTLLFIAGALAGAGQVQRETKRKVSVEVDYPLPGGLDALWAMSDTVARVRVVEGRPYLKRHLDAPVTGQPVVRHTVEIRTVFKEGGGLSSGQRIDVDQITGQIEEGDTIYSVPEPHPMRLLPGRDYVLFLKRNKDADVYQPWCGPHSIYELKNGKAESYGHSYLSSGLESELLSRLASLK
jgi:hypothetical protein